MSWTQGWGQRVGLDGSLLPCGCGTVVTQGPDGFFREKVTIPAGGVSTKLERDAC